MVEKKQEGEKVEGREIYRCSPDESRTEVGADGRQKEAQEFTTCRYSFSGQALDPWIYLPKCGKYVEVLDTI